MKRYIVIDRSQPTAGVNKPELARDTCPHCGQPNSDWLDDAGTCNDCYDAGYH